VRIVNTKFFAKFLYIVRMEGVVNSTEDKATRLLKEGLTCTCDDTYEMLL
jgi:hypothetical protein